MARRLLLAVRLAVVAGAIVAAVGVAGHFTTGTVLGGVWLTAALGPTTYVMLARADDVSARLGGAVIAHATGIAAGLVALAVFGTWGLPSVAETHYEALPQAGAQALAIVLTVLVLVLADVRHPPAAATTLLVASGIAGPGMGLIGLAIGLVIVLAVTPPLARLLAGAARPQNRSGSASFQSSAQDSGGSASS